MDNNEFHSHLFDKLWENIIHKENRLWTFLSVYGAVIGLAIGTDFLSEFALEKGLVILVLTYWGLELILESDWWSIRNRLMIQGIESKSDGTKGVIPSFYSGPNFSTEGMHNVSVFVFMIIGVSLYFTMITSLEFNSGKNVANLLLQACVLYCSASLITMRIAYKRRKYVELYYSTFIDLNKEWDKKFDIQNIRDSYRKSLLKWSWITWCVFIYVLISICFCWKLSELLTLLNLASIVVLQFGVLVVVFIRLRFADYKLNHDFSKLENKNGTLGAESIEQTKNRGEKISTWLFWIAILLFVSSLVLPFVFERTPSIKITSELEISKIQSEVEKLNKSLDDINSAILLYQANQFVKQEIDTLRNQLTTISISLKDIEEANETLHVNFQRIDSLEINLKNMHNQLNEINSQLNKPIVSE